MRKNIATFMAGWCLCMLLLLLNQCHVPENQTEMTLKTIHERTSIRDYADREVEEEKLEQLLKAAMAAPSSRNVQPWQFYVIHDGQTLRDLADKLPSAGMLANAPVAVVVCGDTEKGQPNPEQQMNWIMDCSAATQNLLLAAQSMGLGAVWTGVYPYRQRIDIVRSALEIPDNLIPLNIIPIGYPAEHPKPKDKWDPDKIEKP